jgi:hypothetical protein
MGGQVNSTAIQSFPATTARDPYLRVTIGASDLSLAGALDVEAGTLDRQHIVSGVGATEQAAVLLRNAPGTAKMVSAGSFSALATVYGAANGTIDDTPNANPIGVALTASGAAGDYVTVLRQNTVTVGRGDHNDYLSFFDDFIGDYSANATAFTANGWSKVETNGSGVTSVDVANGVLSLAFDAVAEAATSALYMANNPFDIDDGPIVDFRLAIFDIGDTADVDINFGIANDSHADDADSITESCFFHLDGTDLSLLLESDDGSAEQGDIATGVTLVDDVFYDFRVDMTDKASVTFWYKAVTAVAWTQLASGTTFVMSNATGTLTPIIHVEKTSNDTTADVRVDFISFTAARA